MRTRGLRAFAVVGLGGALVAGCAGASEPGSSSAPGGSAAVSPPSTAWSPDDEALVRNAFHAYWDAVVAVERDGPDPTAFDGVATGVVVEQELRAAQNLADVGVSREGAPAFSDVQVQVEGDSAVVLACVDSSGWLVPGTDTTGLTLVNPGGVALERQDGRWLVTGTAEVPQDMTC